MFSLKIFLKLDRDFTKNHCSPSKIVCGSCFGVTACYQLWIKGDNQLHSLIAAFCAVVLMGSSKLFSQTDKCWRIASCSLSRTTCINFLSQSWSEYFLNYWNNIQCTYIHNSLLLGELHLTPIHGVLQLRPSFEYLNKGEANMRQVSNLTEEGTFTINPVFLLCHKIEMLDASSLFFVSWMKVNGYMYWKLLQSNFSLWTPP